MLNNIRTISRSKRRCIRAGLGMLLVGVVVGSTPRAVAEEFLGVSNVGALSTTRDPLQFIQDLSATPARPVILLTRDDAVAYELLRYARTMSQVDALQTASALNQEADTLGWDPLLFVAVIHVESYYNHLAVSPVGAEGLMQLMPYTAEWLASRENLAWPAGNSFDPVLNVRLGARYLTQLKHQFGRLDQVLTAYNRGPQATRYILQHNDGLPTEIRDFYATKVLQHYHQLRIEYGHLPLS